MKLHTVKRNALWLMLSLAPAALLASPPQIVANGASIETIGGCPVYLHGVDVSGFEYSSEGYGGGPGAGAFPASEVLTSVEVANQQWNCNFVRIPLNQDLWLGTGTGTPCEASGSAAGDSGAAYQAMVTDVVQYCNNANMYVLLDLHWSGVGTTACSSSQHDMPDINALTFWQSVASTFPASQYPGVVFDLYNEPGGGQVNGGTDLTQSDAGWSFWLNGGTETAAASSTGALPDGVAYYTPGMQALLNAIRSTGASNMVWAGGINWAFDLTGMAGPNGNDGTANTYFLQDVTWGAGVVYAAHIYPWKFNNCGCSGGALAGCADYATKGVLNVKPVMVTEFGPDQPQGYSCGTQYSQTAAVDSEDFVPPMVNWLVTNKVPFSAWNMGSSGPNLIYTSATAGAGYAWTYDGASPGQSTYVPTTYFGSYVLAALTNSANSCVPSNTVSPTSSPSRTFTITPSITATPTSSVSPSATQTLTISPTPSQSQTFTITPSFSATPTVSVTPSQSQTSTITPSYSVTPTISETLTPSPGAAGGQTPEIFPNPFHPDGGSGLAHFGQVPAGTAITIFDMLGHRVRSLVAVGNPEVDTWDGLNDNGRQVVVGLYLVYFLQPTGRHDLMRLAVLP